MSNGSLASDCLEGLRGALEAGVDARRQPDLALGPVDGVDGLAQRHARRQVEGERHRRELALVVDATAASCDCDDLARRRRSGTWAAVAERT